jgi:hypothetical protein
MRFSGVGSREDLSGEAERLQLGCQQFIEFGGAAGGITGIDANYL